MAVWPSIETKRQNVLKTEKRTSSVQPVQGSSSTSILGDRGQVVSEGVGWQPLEILSVTWSYVQICSFWYKTNI